MQTSLRPFTLFIVLQVDHIEPFAMGGSCGIAAAAHGVLADTSGVTMTLASDDPYIALGDAAAVCPALKQAKPSPSPPVAPGSSPPDRPGSPR